MSRFGYTVLGFGGHTPAGGPGVWTDSLPTINTNRYQCVTGGGSAGAIIAGGTSTANSEEWNGSAWENADDNLSANTSAASGGGTASSAIVIGGNRASGTTVCEKWDSSAGTWSNADSTTSVFTAAASSATDKDNAWVCGGWTGSAIGSKNEVMVSASWTVQSADMLTDRLAMAKNQAGSGTNSAAVTGSTGSISDKNEQYEHSSGASGTWSTNAAITTGLTDDPSCFGQTSADDLVVAFGENASGPAGNCFEFNGSADAWTTGNTTPAAVRNNYGGGPTGAGIVTGGYLESAGAYQDDTYTFARAIST